MKYQQISNFNTIAPVWQPPTNQACLSSWKRVVSYVSDVIKIFPLVLVYSLPEELSLVLSKYLCVWKGNYFMFCFLRLAKLRRVSLYLSLTVVSRKSRNKRKKCTKVALKRYTPFNFYPCVIIFFGTNPVQGKHIHTSLLQLI